MKIFLLFSHKLTNEQELDLKNNQHIEEFVYLPKPLQELWSNVPPEIGANKLQTYAKPFKDFLDDNAEDGDWVLISGDFGLTYVMAKFCHITGLKPVYATTRREVVETKDENGNVVKRTVFKHVRFREF